MNEVDRLLSDLADDPTEYLRQGALALFQRNGEDAELALREVPGVGIVVSGTIGERSLPELPLRVFVQAQVLRLDKLAIQVRKTLEKGRQTRPTSYIDGPATLDSPEGNSNLKKTSLELRSFLESPVVGTTRLLELMADAGYGKTVLLEELAILTASDYMPDNYPQPFLLIVDLLGRYVGTVDDAIAGALNNTYRFPGLSQRDVALAIRERWIHLALDGFDELVNRVGSREAFQRITELLDQLDNSGTVILSARSTFFELYQISSAIRSYLKPNRGSYSTAVLRLNQWSQSQGEAVFAALGSENPAEDFSGLLAAFGDDSEIVLNPFFLTRLAPAWKGGDRFPSELGVADTLRKTEFVVGELVEREAATKWTDPSKNQPLLTVSAHSGLLEGIAEEMWRTGTPRLSGEELAIASQIASAELRLSSSLSAEVEKRIATHAAFTTRERGYSFKHDKFFHHYLGKRLARLALKGDFQALQTVFSVGELPAEVCDWVSWQLRLEKADPSSVCAHLETVAHDDKRNPPLESNVGQLIPRILDGQKAFVALDALTFRADAFRARSFHNVTFRGCEWWQADLSGSEFVECNFDSCTLGDVAIDAGTRWTRSTFSNCQFRALDIREERPFYDPEMIEEILRSRGASIQEPLKPPQEPHRRVSEDVVKGLSRLVRKAERSCDLAQEDVEGFLPHAKEILKLALDTGVLRTSERTTSGAHKEFVRFRIDKQELVRGEAAVSPDERINRFWEILEQRFPRKSR